MASRFKAAGNQIAEGSSDAEDLENWIKGQFPSLDAQFVVVKDILAGIFIQDAEMRSMFSRFPEVLLSDATYKTNDLNMPLYTLMAVDGNGASQVAALFLMASEDAESLFHLKCCHLRKPPKTKLWFCPNCKLP